VVDNEDEIRRTVEELDKSLNKIRSTTAGKQTFGMEAQYGQAYQRLVRLGARPQLRRKYRG